MSGKVDPNPATPEQLPAVLSKASGRAITAAMIEADIAEGAPTNADGTVHLVHYMAWLLKATASGSSSERRE